MQRRRGNKGAAEEAEEGEEERDSELLQRLASRFMKMRK